MIKQELATVIMRELDDPRLEGVLPSINRVKVAEDLSTADVYIVMMGSDGKQSAGLAALRHAGGKMRSRLASSLNTRITPLLRFHLDEAYRKEMQVLDLIAKAEKESAEYDQANAESDQANAESGSDTEDDVNPQAEQEN